MSLIERLLMDHDLYLCTKLHLHFLKNCRSGHDIYYEQIENMLRYFVIGILFSERIM